MKKILILLLTFPIFFSNKSIIESPTLLSSYVQNKKQIFNLVREHAKKYSQGFPSGHERLIRNMQGSTEFKMTQIPISQLHTLQSRFGLPQELTNQLSMIKYTQNQVYSDVNFHVMKGQSVLDNIFGLAKREQNNEIFFAYIRGNTNGELIQQYTTVSVRRCRRIVFVKRCGNYDEQRPRGMDANELDIIKRTLEAKFYSILQESINMDNKQIYKLFRDYANRLRVNYPSNWNQFLDEGSLKASIDFQTHEIPPHDIINPCRSINLPDKVINHISQVQHQIGRHIDFYHVYSQDPFNIHIIYGIVLRTQNSLVFSFIFGRAQAKISIHQCRFNNRKNILLRLRQINNPDDCHRFVMKFFNKNAQLRNNIQKISNDVFIAKFIQLLQQRLAGLDF